MIARSSFVVVVGSLAASLAACGGAGEARSPAKMAEPEATSVEEAQQQIAAAKAQLAGAGGSGAKTEKAGEFAKPPGADAERPRDTAPAPPPPTQSKKPSSPDSSVESSATSTGDERCSSPCRALASMRRAVGALCRMTGTEDARCVDARRTLAESEGRVSPCSC